MTNDTTLLYTRTQSQSYTTRGANVVITTRQQIARVDPRTGEPDLATRTMAETIEVRPRSDDIWSRA